MSLLRGALRCDNLTGMRLILAPILVCLSILVVGCTSNAPSLSESPSPDVSAAPSGPIADPVESSGPVPITEKNLFEICIAKVLEAGQLASGDPSNVSFAPRAEEITLTRDDGYVGVYFVVNDGNNPNSTQSAVNCVAKGTVQQPDWYTYGVGTPYATDDEAIHLLQMVPQA